MHEKAITVQIVPGQSNTHPPSSTEVLEFLLLHSSGETQTVKDPRGSHLRLVCIQLLQTLIQLHQLLTFGYEGVRERHLVFMYYKYMRQFP